MTPHQRAAWRALGLGPIWVRRDADPLTHPAPIAETVAERPPSRIEALAGQTGADVAPASHGADAALPAMADWEALRNAVRGCERCGLCRSRQQTVFGSGNPDAPWLIVGEAPGAEEDLRGEPFVGQAGRLLDAMLAAIGLDRGRDVFITNVLKCRPPGNRNPEPDEVARCAPFLRRQIELLAPTGILVMGRFAAQALLETDASVASLRNRVHRYTVAGIERPMVVTYHPAYLLRNPADKAKAWADLCLAKARLPQGRSDAG
jgi:uracil-DNA glycosylase family 4